MAKVEVEVFTHPICTGCWDTKKMLEEVVGELRDLVEWREWSLAVPSGRARAQACGVLEVPTIIIQNGERIVGVPRDAAALRERIMAAAGSTTAGKGAQIMPTAVLDVRAMPPRERHPKIFETFEGLKPGETFVLMNDHDPKPLFYQFSFERAGAFTWKYLEEGPEVWRVEIGKTK